LKASSHNVRLQVKRILASEAFARSERMARFLRFTVEHALAERPEKLKEYVIGVEVFDRDASFDPRLDPIVRVEARRLRAKLTQYYDHEGRADELCIEFPKGSYVPVFHDREPSVAAPQPQESRTIAVLPFANLSPEADNEYFSDGLTEELIHALTKIEELSVVAWNTAIQLKNRPDDLPSIARQLNAGTIVTGSVRRFGERLRIGARLINGADGRLIWSEIYDRRVEDIFAIQQELSEAIARTLRVKLAPPRPSAARHNLEAYNAYLKGRFHWNKRDADGLFRSLELFHEAIRIEPNFAQGYAGLADAYTLISDFGIGAPAENIPKARAAAQKAIELNPTLGEAECSLGLIAAIHDWEWARALEHFKRAIELNPGYATAHHWIGVDYYALRGQYEVAMEAMERAIGLDPLSAIIRESRGYVYVLMRRYEDAIASHTELIELFPGFRRAYSSLGRAWYQAGDYRKAIAMYETAREYCGDVPNLLGALGQAYASAGCTDKARHLLRSLLQMANRTYVGATCVAMVYIGLGEYEEAINWLEKGVRERHIGVTAMGVHPAYDPMRTNPRFEALVSRIGAVRK
jgi:TolB-like protein/Flp pilus assembly protein TadD